MTLTEDLAVLRTDAHRILRRLDDLAAGNYQADVVEVYRAVAVIAHEMAEFSFNCVDAILEQENATDDDDDYEPFFVEPDDGA